MVSFMAHSQTTSEKASEEAQADAPRVSVVVPSYNHAPFVARTLRSIMAQTLAPAELIVIDDGSSDGSPRVIERTLNSCPFPCELIARENRGLPATLNEGLARARGRYFAYLGSDDLWLAGFLRARVALLAARPQAALAYGHAYLIDAENRIVDCTQDWARYADGDARRMLLQTIAPMSPTVLYRRAALARHGWNEAAQLEDYDLYLRLSLEGEFAFDARVLSAWRRHGRNTSGNQMMMLEEQLQALRRLAPQFGLNDAGFNKLRRRLSFARAEDFLRLGRKTEALSLMRRNLSGATLGSALARILLRLVVPYKLVELRQRSAQRRAAERYGSINI